MESNTPIYIKIETKEQLIIITEVIRFYIEYIKMDGYEPAPYLAKLSNYLKTLQNIS
jgi:hypothetical protein